MPVFENTDFSDHEQVVFCTDRETGLKAIIAIHDTSRGPALGGCRMWAYGREADAVTDVLRLARGMTYKAAISDLPLGGGKSVILGDATRDGTPELFRAMGRAVGRLGGRYIAAEDVGTSTESVGHMAEETVHVSGLAQDRGGLGDPSPHTARGVFMGLKAGVRHALGRDSLAGLRIGVQGLGHVGLELARLLHQAGARLTVADIRDDAVRAAVAQTGAEAAPAHALHAQALDVFAPCALGAGLDDRTIPEIRARVVAGAANNQLAEDRHGDALAARGITYVPDYVLNAGGLMVVAAEYLGEGRDGLSARIDGIHDTVLSVLDDARTRGIAANRAADRIAEARLTEARQGGARLAAARRGGAAPAGRRLAAE